VTLAVLAAPAAWAWSSGELGLATVWALVGLALAAWVAGPTPWPTFLPAPGPGARLPVAVLALVAAYSAAAGHSLVRALVPYAVALALPLLSRLGGGAVDRAAAWFGRTVGHVVSTVLFTLLGVLTVALPWLVQRALRIDPLHPTTSWNRRARRAMQPGQPWAPSPTRTARTTAERVRNLGLTAAVVVGLLVATPVGRLLVQTVSGRVTSAARPFQLDLAPEDNGENLVPRDAVPEGVTETPHDPDAPQAAMVTSEWLEDGVYQSAQGWALDPRNAWRPVNPHRLQDFTSRDLTIRNGERRTWAPPASGQTRLTVWMFGGSTTYGLNQRDDHTIASELARAAAANGIELDIHNKGNNGQLHWMESERFAWDLTTEPAPDLVLFYDGVNETWEGSTLNRFSTGDVPDMYDPTLLDAWENGREGTSTDAPAAPPGARLVGRPRGPVLGLVGEAKATIDRYDRARALSKSTATAHSLPVRYFWQPSRYSRPLVLSEPHYDTANENNARVSEQLKVKYLPKDVIDLSDSLRGTTEPLFTDDVHHNEEGARLIAAKMFTRIKGDLQELVAAKKGTP
jgi:lysophospholipase L1-like esterase